MLLTIPNTFANGTGEINVIDAPKMNANFAACVTVLNGNIEADNVKTGSAIAIKNITQSVSAVWTFTANPVFNAGAIADAALSSNIPKKNAVNIFTAMQGFPAGIDLNLTQAINHICERVTGLPAWDVSYKGRILYNNTDNKFYGANDSTWVDLGYVGGYTGGTVRSYANQGITDDWDQYYSLFKTEGVTPTVKIFIRGDTFPRRFYTELPYHTHVFTGTAHTHTITDPGHYHGITLGSHGHGELQFGLSTHVHSITGNTGGDGISHTHVATLAGTAASTAIWHTHTFSETSGAQSVTHTHSGTTLGIANSTAHTHDGVVAGGAETDSDGIHTHGVTGSTGNASVGHTHSVSGTTSNENPAHTHSVSVTGTTDAGGVWHSHTISFSSGTPSSSAAVSSADLGDKYTYYVYSGVTAVNTASGGTNSYAGIYIGGEIGTIQKLYGHHLVVKIDGTDVTSNILSSTGWSYIGDGTDAHAFHTAGTGEMDASAWKSYTAGFHTLEIIEPTNDYGCSLRVHIETS